MPNSRRQPMVQFRLENETFALLLERVKELATQGTITSVNMYCRALVISAIGQPKDTAFADEISMMAHDSKHRVARLIGELLEENMSDIVKAALTRAEDE